MAPSIRSALLAGTAMCLVGSVAAGAPDSVQSAPTADMQRPNCNSYASILAYLSVEAYYGKHPYNNPAYGQWNVPCDPAYINKSTGAAFPADFITCSPNALNTHGNYEKNQDRMFVCIQKKACSRVSTASLVGNEVFVGASDATTGGVLPLIKDTTYGVAFDPAKAAAPVSDADFTWTGVADATLPYLGFGKLTADDQVALKTSAGAFDTETKQLKQTYLNAQVAGDEAELLDYNSDYGTEKSTWTTWYTGTAGAAFRQLCGERYIVFSGTDDGSDAITDASISPVVLADTIWHGGFVVEYNQWSSIVTSLAKPANLASPLSSNFQAIFAGHSLGGGVAQIAATVFKKANPSVPVKYFSIGGAAAAFDNTNWSVSLWDNIPAHRYVNTLRTCEGASYGDNYYQDPVPTLGLSIPGTPRHTLHNDNVYAPKFLYTNEVTGSTGNVCWHQPGWLGQCGQWGCGWPTYNCYCPSVIGCQTVTVLNCGGTPTKSYGPAPSGYKITNFDLHSSFLYLKNINQLYLSQGGW